VSEVKRGILRILSNYVRLAITLVIGLATVRILLGTIGDDAYGVIAFLGSTVGLAAMLRDIVNRSMIRELGEAYHSNDDKYFIEVYNSALVLTTVVGVLTLGLFVVVWWTLPLFNVPDKLLDAARLFVIYKAVQTFVAVVVAPAFNGFVVSERMVIYNFWLVADRCAWILASAGLIVFNITDPAEGIIFFGLWTAVFIIAGQLACSIQMMVLDRRMVFKPWLFTGKAIRSILTIGGWNVAVVFAMNLHERIVALLMFLSFGPLAGRLFGVSNQLTSYTRMIATGVTTGLDAVSARISSTRDENILHKLIHQGTRLHGIVIFPAITAIFILAKPLLEVWVGDRLENTTVEVPMAANLVRVLCLGIACRSISDGWMFILYGAGHIRSYAPTILIGGLATPVLAGLSLWLLPDQLRFYGAAGAFSLVLLVVHTGIFPVIGARTIALPASRMFTPLIPPALATLACVPVLLVEVVYVNQWTLVKLAAAAAVYGVAYSLACLLIVLTRQERRQIMRIITRPDRDNGVPTS
jgi:O-antigen/teichoic acid export membrane protein